MGCLNHLYESVENLEEEQLQNVKGKELLLHPQSAAELYCRNLKLNLVNSNFNEYYICGNPGCPLSTYQTAPCHCGSTTSYGVKVSNPTTASQDGAIFARPAARFMITDDFRVAPMSSMAGLNPLSELKATHGHTIEERTINIGREEAPFSVTILESTVDRSIYCRKFGPRSTSQSQGALDSTKKDTKITLKLIVDIYNNRVLYAEAKEGFVDLICSFLIFPLGYIFKEFPCLALRGCLDNLYKSIQDFDVEESLISNEMKAILVDPKLAPGLACNSQFIPVEEPSYPSLSYVSSLYTMKHMKPTSGEAIIGKGFIKGPSLFMVTDNLTALCLLKAALLSESALTDAFVIKETTQNYILQ
ncbi:uncharacterized protein LOC132295909 [Cornus florida]|uniref:uncharacterized protein LOC132295909 n=1 Tax=Cornus florida TaxID=4283 RepID=UPI0028A22C3A|nr:uncharacterized protein LOC132295909 [Cornus florida]